MSKPWWQSVILWAAVADILASLGKAVQDFSTLVQGGTVDWGLALPIFTSFIASIVIIVRRTSGPQSTLTK